ncbi:bacillithiol biosynthesis deacetylase BshB1 [Heliorestis acidaminivorans]|nr:bacillithiol biosynthesis deacetylase BshB1 [Heliorestis acidaminivorans]
MVVYNQTSSIEALSRASNSCHILAFGAHPDDIELSVGGIIALASQQGYGVVIVDLTRGEMATKGTAEIREEEAKLAADLLGVRERRNCSWPDGSLSNPLFWSERIEELVMLMRRYRPQIVLAPGGRDRHPDHEGASELVRQALFYAGIEKYVGPCDEKEELGEPWRPRQLYHYRLNASLLDGPQPLLVDVSSVYELKKKAIVAYASQFGQLWEEECQRLGIPHLLHWLVGRDKYLGGLANVAYAEPLYGEKPFVLKDLSALWE